MNALFAAFVLVSLGSLFGVVHLLRTRGVLGAEAGRKLVHLAMGLVCLPMPWFFRTSLPVWAIACGAGVFLACVRLVPFLQARLGHVLGSVSRASLGDLFYPVGVAAAFSLSQGQKCAYCVAVGVLAFGDSAGALVGGRWGRRAYGFAGSRKTLEGTCAVCMVSLMWTALCLSIDGESLLPALGGGAVMGSVAGIVEAAAGFGADNLLLPLVAAELTRVSLRGAHAPTPLLAWACAGAMGLAGVALLAMRPAAMRSARTEDRS